MTVKHITFRVDASLSIGTGHVTRCLALAIELRQRQIEVEFICREHEGNLCDLIEGNQFRTIRLPRAEARATIGSPAHASWLGGSWEEDAELTCSSLQTTPDWLVVDHYSLDRRWESRVRSTAARVMVIDDLADRTHDCDILLDQNLVENMHTRYEGKVRDGCALLLGPEFALLQSSYAEAHRSASPRSAPVRRLLIFVGGVDSHGLTARAISGFLALDRSDVEVDVVLPGSNPYEAAIRQLVTGHGNIHLHAGLATLAPLMEMADLAIGAGGTTSWERLCLGLPSLTVATAENQRSIAEELGRRGLIRYLGFHDRVDEGQIARALRECLESQSLPEWSSKCLKVVDGLGASRVSAVLGAHCGMSLRLRRAVFTDEARLLEWANDPVTRKNAFSPMLISPAEHQAWLHSRLQAIDICHMFITETEDGIAVGQVRFDLQGSDWIIDYSVSPLFRGHGLGRRTLELALGEMGKLSPGATATGHVKLDNLASRRVFSALGFISKESASAVEYRSVLPNPMS